MVSGRLCTAIIDFDFGKTVILAASAILNANLSPSYFDSVSLAEIRGSGLASTALDCLIPHFGF